VADLAGVGFFPAKSNTECDALGISLVWMPLVWAVLRTYQARWKQWWWWWEAGSGRSDRDILPCQTEN
jgi:hypothetical protein